jgi:hypothetical protein
VFFGLQPIIPIHEVIHGLVLVAHGPVTVRHQHLPEEAAHSTHGKGRQGGGGCKAAMNFWLCVRSEGGFRGLQSVKSGWKERASYVEREEWLAAITQWWKPSAFC